MNNRRSFLKHAAAGLALGATSMGHYARVLAAEAAREDRILVVLELSGGNDGLNTIVPYGDDAYYRLRPTIGIKPGALRKLDQHWGFNPGLLGFERLWHNGELALMHGCGYVDPSFSHFTSMAYWQTAAPNSGDEYGWYGRLADALAPKMRPNFLINIDTSQSLAVKSRVHTPVVFDDPERFARRILAPEHGVIDRLDPPSVNDNPTLNYLQEVTVSAAQASSLVREAWAKYKSPVDYGLVPLQLPKVAACIQAGLPAKLYYLAFRNNAFDTHVQQPDLHQRLLSYMADAVHGFVRDLERLGQGKRVSVLVFSEFGRRATENTNRGTDHGTANFMFLAGQGVSGGHYGKPVSLTELDAGDNLRHTTDFRQVYATAIDGWLQGGCAKTVLKGEFETFPVFKA